MLFRSKQSTCTGDATGGAGTCACKAGFAGTPTFDGGAWTTSMCKVAKPNRAVVMVKTSTRLQGLTAATFTPALSASFKKAIEDTLVVEATVKDIVATDVTSRRRLGASLGVSVGDRIGAEWSGLRRLATTSIDVAYTLEVKVMDGDTEAGVFTALVADLKKVIKDTTALKDAIADEMGEAVVLNTDHYEVPTSFQIHTVETEDRKSVV